MPHPIEHRRELPEGRLAFFWVFGTILVMAGAWIVGKIEWTLGTTPLSYYGSLFLAFLLMLIGGFAWIAVAVSIAHHH